jgi:serine/threonine protein phosphatase 1
MGGAMLSRVLSHGAARPAARTPPGCVVWAIGDIHGRSDLVDRLLQGIRTDLYATEAARKVVVFLGDAVDRGLDSRGVLNQLCNFAADPALEVHFIRGNHEDRMLAFMEDPMVGPGWCDYGGRDTLASYGLTAPAMRGDIGGWAETADALRRAMPEFHHDMLASLQPHVVVGDYFFTHAGARPGVPLINQSLHDLMWIREPFLDDPALFEMVVVHGHTPADAVHSDQRRVGVDTGAYATNVLSAVRLDADRREIMQATGRGGRVTIRMTKLAR